MQIHELTSRNQTTNEGVVSALAGGIAKQVGQQILQKQGAAPNRFAGQRVAPGQMRGGAAMAANMPALQLMSKKAQEAWIQTQQELMQKSNPPTAKISDIPADQLKPHLMALITQLAGFDTTKELSGETATPEMADAVADARDFIEQNVEEIMALTLDKTGKSTAQPLKAAWDELVINGIGPMQTYAQNAGGMARTGGTAAAPQQQDPAVEALLKSMTQAGQAEMQKHVQGKLISSTKIPVIDGLLAQLGAKVQ